ncbi:hypothetical protein HU200_009588 [Digitaria exilis]|uniref:Glycosyltransferase n=1 Tax=Digitaria exilis TaxID=1010633 RepID=A0A835FKH6_9POAL|nr:hypothetical protein HU200_009588 [Digitaria exilis]
MATTAVSTRNDGDAAATSVSCTGEIARRRLRVFFLPSFARGHLIPQTDLACLMAAARPGEVEATMVVSPANASVIAPTGGVRRGRRARRGACSARHTSRCSVSTAPDAIVADVPFWWATEVAAELGVPRLTFHPVGVFPQLAMNNLFKMRSEIIRVSSVAGAEVSVPDLPGKEITIPVSELPSFLVQDDHLSKSWDQIKSCQLAGFGVIVNTFVDLEQPYCEEFRRVDARRAYFVGPLAQPSCSTVNRGGEGDVECLSWLSTKPSRSVVYVCFGSWAHFSVTQSRELALGLEASNHPFLWVVRSDDGSSSQWGAGGVGAARRRAWHGRPRVGPQVAVLAHPSVGAFVTHCGWNSVLEAASAGVPVLTWPLVFEQFINERLVTTGGVAAFGARVWAGGTRGERVAEAEATVPAEAIARAVARFMDGGAERQRMQARAGELAELARAAVGENGSSWRDIHRLIDDLVQARTSSSSPQNQEESPVGMNRA